MLVCHCNVVSDRAIRAAIDDGACDVAAVTAACGAGGTCCGCVPAIERLLADAALGVRDPEALAGRHATAAWTGAARLSTVRERPAHVKEPTWPAATIASSSCSTTSSRSS